MCNVCLLAVAVVDPPLLAPIEYIADVVATPTNPSPTTKDSGSVKDGGSPSGDSKAEKREVDKPPIGVIMRWVNTSS